MEGRPCMLVLAYVEGEGRKDGAVHLGGSPRLCSCRGLGRGESSVSPFGLSRGISAALFVFRRHSSDLTNAESLAGNTVPKLSIVDNSMREPEGVWTTEWKSHFH